MSQNQLIIPGDFPTDETGRPIRPLPVIVVAPGGTQGGTGGGGGGGSSLIPDTYTGPTTYSAANGTVIPIGLGNGQGTVAVTLIGLTASGATLTATYSDNKGTNTFPVRHMGTATLAGSTTINVDGGYTFAAAGHTNLYLTVTTGGTGTFTAWVNVSQPVRTTNLEGAGTASGNPLFTSSAHFTYTLSTGATSAGTVTLAPDVYAPSFPTAFNGATGTLTLTDASGNATTYTYTAPPAVAPTFTTYGTVTASIAWTGGTPTGTFKLNGGPQLGGGGTDAQGNLKVANRASIFYNGATGAASALAASATFTGATRDSGVASGAYHQFAYFNGFYLADATGTAYLDCSNDGATFYVCATSPLTANAPVFLSVPILTRYHRARVVNGATAQTSLYVNSGYTGG